MLKNNTIHNSYGDEDFFFLARIFSTKNMIVENIPPIRIKAKREIIFLRDIWTNFSLIGHDGSFASYLASLFLRIPESRNRFNWYFKNGVLGNPFLNPIDVWIPLKTTNSSSYMIIWKRNSQFNQNF